MLHRLFRVVFTLYRPVFFLWVLVGTGTFSTLAMIAALIGRSSDYAHLVARLWANATLFLAGARVHTHGTEWIAPGQPYVVMSNHQSHFDVLSIIGRMPLQLRWVMKKELRKIPIFGIACAVAGHIYVDRGKSEKARRSLEAAGAEIRRGTSVVFFPEGTRSFDGRLKDFKKGGFHVARAAGVPILPVTVSGSRELMPPRRWWRLAPGVINIVIHPSIELEPYRDLPMADLIIDVRAVIGSGLPD